MFLGDSLTVIADFRTVFLMFNYVVKVVKIAGLEKGD